MSFLKRIAEQFSSQYGNNIHRLAFVFPTRRAGLYFTRHLQNQKKAEEAVWAPPVFSMNDFIIRLSGLTVSESLDLVFELYGIYNKHIRHYPRDFEDFYPWGKMIIADFDEIDKYLIDTAELFRVLKEFKGVEDITKDEKSGIYNRYTGFWEDLGKLYSRFNRLLKEKNKAYEGMAYRQAAENIALLDARTSAWDKVIFCGLNALSRSETVIIRHLLEKEKAEIYWDADRYFVEDANQEAGLFFRRNMEALHIAEPRWVDDGLLKRKTINLIGVQSKVSQAKVLGLKLEQLREFLTDPEDVAVVLPDETLLFPALNSLPEAVERVNVTIGYPLRQTPVYSLLNAVLEMQARAVESGLGFYYKDVRKVLNHPYIKPIAEEEITAFLDEMKKQNRVYVGKADIDLTTEPLKDLFEYRDGALAVIGFFLDILDFIRTVYTAGESGEGPVIEPGLFHIDYEYIFHFYTLLSRLRDSLKAAGLELDLHTFQQLFGDIVKADRIPFTGEPLEGMQIMGVLETQTLDFSNLFVLSVNEGYLPPGKSQQSFIPYDVRAEMGLPTYKDRDAVAAYHFYRLLKNSENITLIYTTEVKGVEKNEKSRFIDQVLIEYAERNKNAVINHRVIDFPFDAQRVKEITVQKSAEIIEALSQKSYSASSLLTYLVCSLKYYFTYVLRLREEEDVSESPEYYEVGHIMHKALHELYKPFCGKGKPVGPAELAAMKEKVEKVLTQAYLDEVGGADLHTGRNRIAFEVMKRFLENFLDKERLDAGFRVEMLEKEITNVPIKFAGMKQGVKLSGTVDRLDMKDGVYRIIDYKTGRINSLNLKSMEELVGEEVVNRKEVFQLFFYRYLIKRMPVSNHDGPYRLGIYPFKKMYDELSYVKVDKEEEIDEGMVGRFEEILGGIFLEIFAEARPFKQTGDEKNCRHCPYVNICSRDAAVD